MAEDGKEALIAAAIAEIGKEIRMFRWYQWAEASLAVSFPVAIANADKLASLWKAIHLTAT